MLKKIGRTILDALCYAIAFALLRLAIVLYPKDFEDTLD